jgi:hypothetical protein
MNRLSLQYLAFSIFIINHCCNLFLTLAPLTDFKKVAFGILSLGFVIIFVGDYKYNYQKKGTFDFAASTYIILSTVMWLNDGVFWVAAGNFFLFVACVWYERRLKLKEEGDY